MDNKEEKITLLKQIREYENRGYKTHCRCYISTDINELKFELEILKRDHYIEQHMSYYKSLCKLFNIPMPPRENILKTIPGTKEFYENYKNYYTKD
jgi:hypothetical protein